jgi:metal-responsive CopG/Arc/MetJ family transcriptional regulator
MDNVRFNIYLKKELAHILDKLASKRAKDNFHKPNRSRLIGELILDAKREEDAKKAA